MSEEDDGARDISTIRALARMDGKLESLIASVSDLKRAMENVPRDFIGRDELEARFSFIEQRIARIERFGGGVVGFILLSFGTALAALVFNQ